jgi:uncharacterized protein (DUF58 family)
VPRPTKRFAALLVGAAALFAVGTNVQSGWLLVISSLLVGAAASGYVLPLAALSGIDVARRAPDAAYQGSSARVDLDVENRSRRPRLGVVVEDEHASPARVVVPPLGPGARLRLRTTRRAARRGVAETDSLRLSSSAPFGVAVARRTLRAPSRTVVYPAVVGLDALPASWGLHATGGAPSPTPRRGDGADYLGIREYRAGDSMRHVHWPSTARTGVVMVRELESEVARSLTVVVDTLADVVADPAAGPTPLDRCCTVAASVGLAASRDGRAVRFVAARAGEVDVLESTDPSAVLAWLAALRPGGGLPLGAVLTRLSQEVADAGSCLVACPTWEANSAEAVLGGLGRLGGAEPHAVVLVDARGFGGRPAARTLRGDASTATAEALERSGVRSVLVRGGDDLAAALRGVLRGAP